MAKNVLVAQSQAQAGRAELKRLQTEMERASQEDTQFQNRMIYPCGVGLGGRCRGSGGPPSLLSLCPGSLTPSH